LDSEAWGQNNSASTLLDGLTRRRFVGGAGLTALGMTLGGMGIVFVGAEAAGPDLPAELSESTRAAAIFDALPGKKPLIKLSYRPPNYETPIEYFRTAITPNEAFFVRYHLSNIPKVDAATWKLAVRSSTRLQTSLRAYPSGRRWTLTPSSPTQRHSCATVRHFKSFHRDLSKWVIGLRKSTNDRHARHLLFVAPSPLSHSSGSTTQ